MIEVSDLKNFALQIREKISVKRGISNYFDGSCGLAQCLLFHGLQDLGIAFTPFSTQSVEGYYYGHASGSITLENGESYLIDPTFIQFDDVTNGISPSKFLQGSAEGKEILSQLRESGFFELTPQSALLYLNSFMNGHPCGMSSSEALSFLLNPPNHEFQMVYAHDNRQGTREQLARDGFSLNFKFG